MSKISALFLILFLCSFYWIIPRIRFVEAQSKTIVVPDDYSTIQDAVDAASDGDTVFVKNGVYNKSVEISKPLSLIGEDSQNTIFNFLSVRYYPRGVIQVSADNVTVSGFKIINNPQGLGSAGVFVNDRAYGSPRPTAIRIMGNIFVNCSNGIFIRDGFDVVISGNNFTGNEVGINIGSSNTTVSENNISNNLDYGIIIHQSSNVTIKGNIVKGNGYELAHGKYRGSGINIGSNGPVYVHGNNISDNRAGILLHHHNNNTLIYENNIEHNGIGIEFINSLTSDRPLGSGNIVYKNNVIANFRQVLVNKTSVIGAYWDGTRWNGTATALRQNNTTGNYWSNYNGIDDNEDGVGDTPYIIDENNQDNYPSMNLFEFNKNPDSIDLFSNTSLIEIIGVLAVLSIIILIFIKFKKKKDG